MPIASAIASDTGKASHAGLEREAAAGAAGAEDQRHRHRGERHHRFDRQVHVAGDQRQRQADGDDADEGRLLEDVQENADLEEIRNREREAREHDDEDEPDEIVEDELERRLPPRRGGVDRSGSTASVVMRMHAPWGEQLRDPANLLMVRCSAAKRRASNARTSRRCVLRGSRLTALAPQHEERSSDLSSPTRPA